MIQPQTPEWEAEAQRLSEKLHADISTIKAMMKQAYKAYTCLERLDWEVIQQQLREKLS